MDTFRIGGELEVRRLGLGAMRLPGVRDRSVDPAKAAELLREALRLGVNLIDTAHIYGRSEELIAQALHPYPDDLVIATKGGGCEGAGIPTAARSGCEPTASSASGACGSTCSTSGSFTASTPRCPSQSSSASSGSFETRARSASPECPRSAWTSSGARAIVEVATVQNRFNAAEQGASKVLAECEAADIAFLPWAPMGMGDLRPAEALEWLLRRSPVVLPIPGTGSVEHLRENMRAASAAAL
jgi:aryl-alcohol dehydrogenase-like predicted oxidoreductase